MFFTYTFKKKQSKQKTLLFINVLEHIIRDVTNIKIESVEASKTAALSAQKLNWLFLERFQYIPQSQFSYNFL